MSSYVATPRSGWQPCLAAISRDSSMSSTEKATRCMPISLGRVGCVSIASGWTYSKSSRRPLPSGVCSMAILAWLPSRPTAVSVHSPLTVSRPRTVSPRSVKKAIVASRSRTAMPTFSSLMGMLRTLPSRGGRPDDPTSRQVPDEEARRGVPCGLRDAGVPAHVGVERLLLRPEGVEQLQGRLPVVSLVIPLQQDIQRNRDLSGLVERGVGNEAAGEEYGGRDAWLDHCQPDTDGDPPARVSDRTVDLGQCKECVEGGPPFRDRL